MKTYIVNILFGVAALVSLALPSVGFAASDDVTLTTDVVITVAGIDLTITGSSATLASITVNTNNFSVDMEAGSYIKVRSADRRALNHDAPTNSFYATTCTDSESTLELLNTNTVTITVTPGASTCVEESSGGGGGGSRRRDVDDDDEDVETVETTEEDVTELPVNPGISAVFVRPLFRGVSGEDVLRLQKLLNTDPDTRVAETSFGSPGNETTYFGPLTENAVQRFQAKYGVVSSGDPVSTGYGRVGPLTRAKLLEVFGS